MRKEPEATIRDYYAAIDAGDVSKAMEIFHSNAIYERPGTPKLEGRAAIQRFYVEERPRGGEHRLEAVAIATDRVLVEGLFHAPDGREVRFADSFVFDDDRVRSRRTYAMG